MAKRIKMLLYGEPCAGKSVFALKAPKPFFICTDGNYEWLDEFGADPDAHKNVSSWAEMKKALESDFDGYETVVVDLLEDGFKWCEQEYCIRNKIEHVSDVAYGKAYDTTRNEFFITISKLLAMDKNVILICHAVTFTTKDRRGVEHTKYAPSNRIPNKVLDMIEGRVRYCLRCYVSAEEETDGTINKRRYLSLIPKENEFGIIRGIDENTVPHDIPLDFNEFAKYIKFDVTNCNNSEETSTVKNKPTRKKVEIVESAKEVEIDVDELKKIVEKTMPEEHKEDTKVEETPVAVVEKPVKAVETTQTSQNVQSDDKLAMIKAKLAMIKAKNN